MILIPLGIGLSLGQSRDKILQQVIKLDWSEQHPGSFVIIALSLTATPFRQASVIQNSSNRNQHVVIVGASSRAAALSSFRQGVRPRSIDLFCDQDTKLIAYAQKCGTYSEIVELVPDGAGQLVLCGGMENHLELVQTLSQKLEFESCDWPSMFKANDGLELFRWSQSNDVAMPRTGVGSLSSDVACLRKPRFSTGGTNIDRVSIDDADSSTSTESELTIIQEEVPGNSYAAVFYSDGHLADLIGITRQLIGMNEFGAGGFKYCGSIGPCILGEQFEFELKRIAGMLVNDFSMQGVFGIDFVLSNDRVWLIEVNPRYPASAEVLELYHGISLVPDFQDLGRSDASSLPKSAKLGKAILYCNSPASVNWYQQNEMLLVEIAQASNLFESIAANTVIADVPEDGSTIKPGDPILTVFAAGETHEICLAELARKAKMIFDRTGGS